MPEKSPDRLRVDAYTEKNLRRIFTGGGDIQGNFYFAGDTQGSAAVLAVTLTRKDKKGAAALTDGKKLRKEIAGAKFGRGLVKVVPGKLVFELASGSASVGHIRLGFKKVLRAEIGLLKNALVVPLGDRSELEEGDRSALEATQSAPSILSMNEQLGEFLSAADAQAELEEQLAEVTSEIERLSRPPVDAEALAARKVELAELMDIGTDPFTVDEPARAVQILAGIAAENVLENLHRGHTVADSFGAAHNLQSEAHGRNTARAKALAARLLHDGVLVFSAENTAAVDGILHELGEERPQTPHTRHLTRTLAALKADGALREKLVSIGAPDRSMRAFIRATLGLGTEIELTAAHSRQAVLSSMLAEMRQGEAGSCFGTQAAIRVHDYNQGQFLDDMKSLVEAGKLTRTIEGTPIDIPVSAGLYEGPLKIKLAVGVDGKVTAVEGTELDAAEDLSEIPELAAALSGLDISLEGRQDALLAAVDALAGPPRAAGVELSVEALLQQIGLTRAGLTPEELALREENIQIGQQMKELGAGLGRSQQGDEDIDRQIQLLVERSAAITERLQPRLEAFGTFDEGQRLARSTLLGQKDNRLLRSWEYTVSALAERERSMGLMSDFGGALLTATDNLEEDPDLVGDPEEEVTPFDTREDIAFDLLTKFRALFKANLAPGYDASYSSAGTADDGVSTGGGFVLYDKTGLDPAEWVPLRDEKSYKDALAGLVRLAVVEKFREEDRPDPEDQDAVQEYEQKLRAAREISARLQERILTGDLVDAMTAQLQRDLDGPERDSVKPWAKEMGNDPGAVYRGYMNLDRFPRKEEQTPTDSEALTKWLTRTMKAIRAKASSTDDFMIPVGSDSHAFLLTPEHPDLRDAWTTDDPEDWAGEKMTRMKEAAGGVRATAVDATMIGRIVDEIPEIKGFRQALIDGIGKIKTIERLLEFLVGPAPQPDASNEDKRKYRIKAATYGAVAMRHAKPPVASGKWLETARTCLAALAVPNVDERAALVVTELGEGERASQADLRTAIRSVLSKNSIEKTDDEIHTALIGGMPDMPSMIFADSNWGGGDHHIQFAMVANPVTGRIEMFRCNEDKTDFQAVPSSSDWVTGKWTVLTEPIDYGG